MFRRIMKWIGGILLLLVVVLAVFLINLIWFRPWSLNLFYEKIFAQVLFEEPELLSSLGLVEQFGITGHNAKLGDVSPAHQQRYFDRAKQNLEELRSYPLERQNASQRLSTKILEWYIEPRDRGRKISVAQLPGKPALRRPERIPLLHGEHASAAGPARLRVLPATA